MVVSRSYGRRGQCRHAFTLLELLAAMAVLLLVVLCITQIVSGAAGTTRTSNKRINADSEARRIFDRISADIAGMLDRPDVDFLVRKSAGNDEFYFFSEAPARLSGSATPQPISLVGYRVSDTQQVERLAQGFSWDAAPPDGAVFLTFSNTTAVAASTLEGAYGTILSDANKFHVLGEGVFRMEIDFLLKATSGNPAVFATSPFRSGGSSPFSNKGKGFSDVQAIVVTLVVLDADSRVIAGDMSNLIGKFGDSANGSTPANAWQAVANDPSSIGIPASAASNLRVYQRVFPLNKFSSTP